MEYQPVIGSFSALLEASDKSKARPKTPVELLGVIAALQAGKDSVPMPEAFERAGLPLAEFGDLISALRTANFIEVSGDWGNEQVKLTSTGSVVANAAKPVKSTPAV